jgi:hypothetical protein
MIPSALLVAVLSVAPFSRVPQATDSRPEVKTLVDKLNEQMKAKGEQDEQAITTLDELTKQFAESGPKDRALIVKEVVGMFDYKRPKELEEACPTIARTWPPPPRSGRWGRRARSRWPR